MKVINENLGMAKVDFNEIGCEYFISNGYTNFKSLETAVFFYKPDADMIIFNTSNENYAVYKQIIESYMQLKESKRKEVIGLAGDDDIMHALNMIDGIMLRRSLIQNIKSNMQPKKNDEEEIDDDSAALSLINAANLLLQESYLKRQNQ